MAIVKTQPSDFAGQKSTQLKLNGPRKVQDWIFSFAHKSKPHGQTKYEHIYIYMHTT